VELIHVDLECSERPEDELGHESGAVGIEEPVESPTDAIVVEPVDLARPESRERGFHVTSPLDVRVDRLTVVQSNVADQDAQSLSGIEAAAAGERLGQEAVEAEAIEDGVDERKARDLAGFQGERRIRLTSL
jgi:hypothetical protein